MLNNRLEIIDKQNKANELSAEIERQRALAEQQRATGSAGVGASSAGAYTVIARLEEKRLGILKEINDLGAENGDLNKINAQLQNEFNGQIAKGADLSGKVSGSIGKTGVALDAAIKLQDTLNKLQQESIQASLSGYQKELQASQFKYDELRKQADEYYRQGKVSAK